MVLKTEVWKEVQRERVQCPKCLKHMTRRVLRWHHTCRTRGPIDMSDEAADSFRSKLCGKALEQLQKRLEARTPLTHDPLPLKPGALGVTATKSPSS